MRLLRDAYIFLRAVEHRLQIQNEQQTHTLPARREAWLGIARTLGYERCRCICGSVALAYLGGAVGFRSASEKQRRAAKRSKSRPLGFSRSRKRRARADRAARGPVQSPRGTSDARLYAKLEPELLSWCSRMAEPDAALNRFVRFVDGLRNSRSAL